jgi:hypothetical protein
MYKRKGKSDQMSKPSVPTSETTLAEPKTSTEQPEKQRSQAEQADAPLKMARAEQAIAKKQTETPEFKRFFGDWDAAAKVKPETKPSLLVQNQQQFP